MSSGYKYGAFCERTRESAADGATTQVSVYHLAMRRRLRTVTFPCAAEFVSCSFTGDGKYLVAASGAADPHVVYCKWDGEKVCVCVCVRVGV